MQQTHSAQYGVTLADVALGAFEWVFSTQGMSVIQDRYVYTRARFAHTSLKSKNGRHRESH